MAGDTPTEALEKYEGIITPFERKEIRDQKFIYTIGSRRISRQAEVMGKDGFYVATPGE
jgi:hypothetical protein